MKFEDWLKTDTAQIYLDENVKENVNIGDLCRVNGEEFICVLMDNRKVLIKPNSQPKSSVVYKNETTEFRARNLMIRNSDLPEHVQEEIIHSFDICSCEKNKPAKSVTGFTCIDCGKKIKDE